MEVRRNTRTAPTFGRQQFAQAEQLDFRPLLQGAADLRAGLDVGRRERQQFDLQKRLLEESNRMREELEQKRRDPNVDTETFASLIDSEYTDRVNAVVDEYRAQNYDVDLVDDFFLGMGRLRNELSDTAVTYQLQARKAKALSNGAALLDEATREVMARPGDFASISAFVKDTLNLNPDLTEEERIAAVDAVEPTLRLVGAKSLVLDDARMVLDQLDPDRRWRLEREAPVTGTATAVVGGALPETDPANRIVNFVARESTGISAVPNDVDTLGKLRAFQRDLVKANTRAGVPDDENSSAVGVYQIVGRTLEGYAKKLYGDDWVNQPFDFARQDEIARAIFEDNNGSASALKKQWVSLTLQEAERIRIQPWEEARKLIARKESGAELSDLAPGGERVPQAGDVTAIALPPSAAGQEANQTRPNLPAEPVELHPVLAALTGAERLDILEAAYAADEKNTAANKAALDLLIENVKAEALANGEVASPIPSEQEVINVLGPVAGPQVYADMTQTIQLGKDVKSFTTLSPAQIDSRVEALRPTPGSPTFATEDALFQVAQKARDQVLEQRDADPAGYVLQNFPAVRAAAEQGEAAYYKAMDRALEKLGYDPATTSPLPKSAQERIIKQWPTMSPTARRQWFHENFARMGEDRIADFARGAEGTDMEQELKIYAASIGRLTPVVIDEIFAGRDAIKKDPARRPPAEKVTAYFRRSAFNGVLSMSPDASAALQEMAAALYVAKGGSADPNQLDEGLYKQALSQALGGALPYNDSKGAVKEYTILPPGVTGEKFEAWLETRQPGDLTRLSRDKLPPVYGDLKTPVALQDIIDDGVFVMLAPGSYGIKMASDGRFLKTSNGRNFVVRLKIGDIK